MNIYFIEYPATQQLVTLAKCTLKMSAGSTIESMRQNTWAYETVPNSISINVEN
jgi:hypothetical protein